MDIDYWLANKQKFSKWLLRNGAEILQDRGDFFEFHATFDIAITGQVSVTFHNVFLFGYANGAWEDFKLGQKWRHNATTPKHCSAARKRVKSFLLDRDGSTCVFCGKPIEGNSSIEHLLDRSSGGSNAYANLALAHEQCNKEAGDLKILRQKIEHIIRKRQC
jgi:hypothetical protein